MVVELKYKEKHLNYNVTGDGNDGTTTTEAPATTPPTSECIDLITKEKCEEHKGQGRCDKWKPFMEEKCRATCGFCKILNTY
jgi:hypothetical protein